MFYDLRRKDEERSGGVRSVKNEMLTAKEVAVYLNINEKTIYRLVREGRLPGTKITGKWTFSRALVRNWIESNSLQRPMASRRPSHLAASGPGKLLIAGSNDLIMERIQTHLVKTLFPEIIVYVANTGSLGGLRALELGWAHIAGVHLYHPETKEYNLPYLKEFLPEEETIVFHLAFRNQGFILGSRSRAHFRGTQDLASSYIRFVNREEGSGTRLLLDYLLREHGIHPGKVIGYSREVFTHMEVGLAILRGEADVGLGIESVAHHLGLDFVQVRAERYDLVVPKVNLSAKSVQVFLNFLHSAKFPKLASGLAGYDLKESGKILG